MTKVNNGYMVNTRLDAPKNSGEAMKAVADILGPVLKSINSDDDDDPIMKKIQEEQQQQAKEDELSGIFVFKTLSQAIDFVRTYYDEK